ncbi:/ / hypothetical protein / 254633:258202 Reverse [Candidatus Hepatoplasma crinochetorum]|uniref:Uncharacterized protein n=1 Tax=Candidatus Hepatoplasma crinochetorum TaxID=295596 RepID=A0A0G7ZNQ4_9MOLU|nr:/ / hypothetical protein / 254633:258202 Reverse [Candidatus Hepatoplasma crinochetorum]
MNTGIAVLNPAEGTSPIILNNFDNIGLSFANLVAGKYTIEIYDGNILRTSEDNVIILEPGVEISNETIIDGMGDGADNGSASATVDIFGYDCVLTAVINPDPNSVNPVPLENGTNEVLFDKLPPNDYTVDIKCDNAIIETFNFTIKDGSDIPDNDGLDDLVIDDPAASGDGTANYNLTDYQLLLIRTKTQDYDEHFDGIGVGIDYRVGDNLYNLVRMVQYAFSYVDLKLISAKDFSIIKTDNFFAGINFIKGYKKNLTPLLNSEISAGVGESVTLNTPIDKFTHFITKSSHSPDSRIDYEMGSVYNLKNLTPNFTLAHFETDNSFKANFINNLTLSLFDNKNSKKYALNRIWGFNIDNNLQNLTDKIFNPKNYSILIFHVSLGIEGFRLTLINGSTVIADGNERYSLVKSFMISENGGTKNNRYVIFNPDGSYKIFLPDALSVVKVEGLILPPIAKAYISNLITTNTSIVGGSDGKITFNVNISGFNGKGIAILDPTEDNLPIDLKDGDNIGLSFTNLSSNIYKILIMDDDDLIMEMNNIIILEPDALVSNAVIIDSMGNNVATGSASAMIKTTGFNNGNVVINPNPNNIDPTLLNDGDNEVIFDNLPPNDYNFEIKNDDNVIQRLTFKINDGPIIPINDGLNDLDVMENTPNLSGGTTQDNLTDYTFLFVNTLVNNSEYGTTLLLGNDLKIEEENYNLGHEWTALEIASRSRQFLTLKLNKANNYSLDSAGNVYNGINFIKGYKKEITPLLNSEISLGRGKISNLDIPIDGFNYIITKSTFNDKFIEYTLTSIEDLSLYSNKYWAGYGRADNLYVNVLNNNTQILVSADGNANNYVNMLWGVSFNNLDDLTNKVFNPKVYTLLLVHFNLNNSAYVGLVYTANIIADGKTKYYLTIINILTYIIFNEDGTYILGNIHNFTKIEGVSLDVVAKANITNLITSDVTINSGNDGSITFDVNISAFKEKGTAILNPVGDTLPIDLNDGDNIGLSFDNLGAGAYKVEIYDDENLITKREDIVISEPVILLKNK